MFFVNTISKIVGDLESKIDKLKKHAQTLTDKATEKEAESYRLVSESAAHKEEASRALRIAEKVKAILD